MKVRTLTGAGCLLPLGLTLLLLLPLVQVSVQTPFALIDDYSDWQNARLLHSPSAFGQWLGAQLVPREERFRPWYYVQAAVVWKVAGNHPAVHHALRWLLKATVLGLFLLVWWCLVPAAPAPAPAPPGLRLLERWFGAATAPAWLLVLLFVFYPNAPEARLAPLELWTAWFLGLTTLAFAQLLTRYQLDYSLAPWWWPVLLVAGYAGLGYTKEPNIALLLVTLGFVLALQDYGQPKLRLALVTACLVAVFVHVFAGASRASLAPSNYAPALSPGRLWLHARWLAEDALQLRTHVLITVGLVGLLGIVCWSIRRLARVATWRTWRAEPESVHALAVLYVLAGFAAFAGVTLTSWLPVPRYWYPLVPLLALLAALGVAALRQQWPSPRAGRWTTVLVAVFALFFVGCNYFNFAMQYVIQRNNRIGEQRLLQALDRLLAQGAVVWVPCQSEEERTIPQYFQGFRQYYDLGPRRVYSCEERPPTGAPVVAVYANPPPGRQPAAVIRYRSEFGRLRLGYEVAWWLQLSNPYRRLPPLRSLVPALPLPSLPYLYFDAGAYPTPNNAWYLYRFDSVGDVPLPPRA